MGRESRLCHRSKNWGRGEVERRLTLGEIRARDHTGGSDTGQTRKNGFWVQASITSDPPWPAFSGGPIQTRQRNGPLGETPSVLSVPPRTSNRQTRKRGFACRSRVRSGGN